MGHLLEQSVDTPIRPPRTLKAERILEEEPALPPLPKVALGFNICIYLVWEIRAASIALLTLDIKGYQGG